MNAWNFIVRAVSATAAHVDGWIPDDDDTIRFLRHHRAEAERESIRLARILEAAVGQRPSVEERVLPTTELSKRWKRP